MLKPRWILCGCNKDKGVRAVCQRPCAPAPGRRRHSSSQHSSSLRVCLRVGAPPRLYLLRDETTSTRRASGVALQTRPYLTARTGPPPDSARRLRLQPGRNSAGAVIEIICRSFSPATLIWTEVNGTELSINGRNPSSSTFANHNC